MSINNKFKVFYKSNGALNITRVQKEWCNKNNVPELYEEIMQLTTFLPMSSRITERMYCIECNITKIVMCKYCDQVPVKYSNENKRYQICCSRSCSAKLQQEQEGRINAFVMDDFLEKSKATKLRKYGDSNYQNYEQRIATNIERYGVANVSQCEVVKSKKAEKDTIESRELRVQKIQDTCIQRYGVRNFTQSEQCVQSRYVWKLYQFKSGDTLNLLGYEPYAAQILENNNIKYTDINTNYKIPYLLNGIDRVYTTDFYISKLNYCIEVKSSYTVKSDNDKNIAKWNAVITNGNSLDIWVIYPNKSKAIKYKWVVGSTIIDVLQFPATHFDEIIVN